jgi:hypothetical protein
MMEPARLTPWWVINTFGDGSGSPLSASHFSGLLSHQLQHWSRRSGIISPDERRKWWDISDLQLPIPQSAAELHSNLTDFLLLNYPLRRKGLEEPSISGAIDTTKLTIAVVGDVRDAMSRTYLHCLGKLIRMESSDLLDAIDVKLLALIYLPHNAHHEKDSNRIAQFLTELHTMMLQPSGELPFESVAFLQDKNYSAPHQRSGYDQLSSTQVIELMSQTLFHSMISEGSALREIGQRYSPAYLSMASVSIYYDWQQHKQKLAEKAGSTLVNTFAFAREAPFIDEDEADVAVNSIGVHLATQSLLTELIDVTKSVLKEQRLALPGKELATDSTSTKRSELRVKEYESMLHLYKEAVRISSQRLVESMGVLWQGDVKTQGAKSVIVQSIREIYTGRSGLGNARALEQAMLVLKRLETLFEEERAHVDAIRFEKDRLRELLEVFELDLIDDPADSQKKKNTTMPALVLLQIAELLSSIPLWAKILTGLLLPASGYLLYRRRKKQRVGQLAKIAETAIYRLSPDDRQSLQRELQYGAKLSLTEIYIQATTLVHKLQVFIENVREHIPSQLHALTMPGYQSTTFFRSVFQELSVPGRPVFQPLITNGDFAPALEIGEQRMKFEEFRKNSLLPILINKFLVDKPAVKACVTPLAIEEADSGELSVASATELSSQCYEFAYELYDESQGLGMNDALRQIKKTGHEDALIAFAAEAAWPPLIFSQATTQRPPIYLELKYHDPKVFQEVLGDQFNGQWGTTHKELHQIRDGDLLSLGIFQPIPVTNDEHCALDCINTISTMKTQINLDELRDPSVVFTLATLPRTADSTDAPALVNALQGIKMLPPAPLMKEIDQFRRELRLVSVARQRDYLWLEERRRILGQSSVLPVTGLQEETYNIVIAAQFKDHISSKPMRLNQPYMLQAAIYEEGFEFSNGESLANEKAIKIDIMIHAEGMDVQPTWLLPTTFKRKRTPHFAEFTLIPVEEGRKTIHIEFLRSNCWLTGIKFEMEVVNQETLVLIS